MTAFIRSVIGGVSNMAMAHLSPYKVQSTTEKTSTSGEIEKHGYITLYKETGCYEAILHNPLAYAIPFRLFRVLNEGEAIASFRIMAERLCLLYNCTPLVYKDSILQQVCNCLREHPLWTAALVAASVGLHDAFINEHLRRDIDSRCTQTQITPLMAAVSMDKVQCIQELLRVGANAELVDHHGDTVYHQAVRTSPLSIPVLTSYTPHLINKMNYYAQTPLNLACSLCKSECTNMLLSNGACPQVDTVIVPAVHIAMKNKDLKSAMMILTLYPGQLNVKENLHGGTPIHWAKDVDAVQKLIDLGCNPNLQSHDHSTPLHVMMARNRFDCSMALICHGVDLNIPGEGGNTHLHIAVILDDFKLVKNLVVFGADVNAVNDQSHSPRHVAANKNIKHSDVMIFVLHSAGARRCAPNIKSCVAGCSYIGHFNGVPDATMRQITERVAQSNSDDFLRDSMLVQDANQAGGEKKQRILCLDGGGIRGIVLAQFLMAIQQAAGKPIMECFDWIGGTSTGGILAIAIATGMSMSQILGMYLTMKDKIFVGDRPHSSEPLAEQLKSKFGEKTRMCDLKGPKVMVTAVMADRHPPVLHLFKSYESPITRNVHADMNTLDYDSYQEPSSSSKQLAWKSGVCSGAAPTYFRNCDFFVDGGIIANNPTLDVLTEIHEYNTAMRLTEKNYVAPKLGVVVSLGTGRNPTVPVKSLDVFWPRGFKETIESVKGISSLAALLTDQLTASDGSAVDRARAWCSMLGVAYYRLSPSLMKAVQLNTCEDAALLDMMWETHCYIVMNRELIARIAAFM